MHCYFCFLLLALNPALASPVTKQETKVGDILIIDYGKDKDIPEINKGFRADDIVESRIVRRSAVSYPEYLWNPPVPFVLHESLELNAKGVILKALDQFRLKSCIDFKIKENEEYYISVEKQDGCYSYIGRYFAHGQTLSIGTYCDTTAIVEHEFLHALGFFHEQSRYDRDRYVTINFHNIEEGYENNFRIADKNISTTHRVPYDFMSVMHYGPYAFSNGNGTTIDTKNPDYQDVIGQRLAMSPSDVLELNLLYKCKSSISFLMHNSFSSASTCGLTRCSDGLSGWEALTKVIGGPDYDHTNLQSYSNVQDPVLSSFMHASTVHGKEGDSAWLETQRMTPGRPCPVQCLQFYYFHSGNELDQLNIWIREFQDENDFEGQSRLVGQITGQRTTLWKYHHVSLNATSSFQVEFEARKGAGSSSGGFSIDDINMSELECPHVAIQIDDFETVMKTNVNFTAIYSPKQYTNDGYAFRMAVLLFDNETYYMLGIQLVQGKNDSTLQWPVLNRQVTYQALDQNPNIQLQMSKQRSITTDAYDLLDNGINFWENPCIGGRTDVDENGQEMFVGPIIGIIEFGTLDELQQRDFLKGGSAVFAFSFQDITPLISGCSLPCPPPSPAPASVRGSRSLCVRAMTTPPDDSIFGFAPGLVSSALLMIFSSLLLLFH